MASDFDQIGIEAVAKGVSQYVSDLKNMEKANDSVGTSAKNLEKSTSGISKAFSDIGKIGAGFLAATGIQTGIGAVVGEVKSLFAAADEAARVQAQLNAVLESTGHVAGITADDVNNLSSALMKQSTFDDEAITSAQSLLLTFTSIGKDIFPEATQAILDMSVAMGQDLQTSTIQIGKALQDPILGMTALRRVGVNFNQEQQDLVKTMVESGHTMEAQKYILAELAKEFGGSAAAAAGTFGGKMQQLNNVIGDIKEKVGESLEKALLPAMQALSAWIVQHQPEIEAFFTKAIGAGEQVAQNVAKSIKTDLIPAIEGLKNFVGDIKEVPIVGEATEDVFSVLTGSDLTLAAAVLAAAKFGWVNPQIAIALLGAVYVRRKMKGGFDILGMEFGGTQTPETGERGLFAPETVEGDIQQMMRGLSLPERILGAITPDFLQSDEWKQAEEMFRKSGEQWGVALGDGFKTEVAAQISGAGGRFAKGTAIAGITDQLADGWAEAGSEASARFVDNFVSAMETSNMSEAVASAVAESNVGEAMATAIAAGGTESFATAGSYMGQALTEGITGSLPVDPLAVFNQTMVAQGYTTGDQVASAIGEGLTNRLPPAFAQAETSAQQTSQNIASAFATATDNISRSFASAAEAADGSSQQIASAAATAATNVSTSFAQVATDAGVSADQVANAWAEATSNVSGKMQELVGTAQGTGEEIADAMASGFGHIPNLVATAVASAEGSLGQLAQAASRTANQIAQAMASATSSVQQAYPQGYGTGTAYGTSSGSGRAAGGPVEPGRPYVVGEYGPELYVPRQPGTIVPTTSQSSSIVINTLNLPNVANARDFVSELDAMQSRRLRLSGRGSAP